MSDASAESARAEVSDRELVTASRAGDSSAFEAPVVRYQNLVCSVAYTVVGDLVASEDIGQESFISACKHPGQGKHRC